MKKLIFDYNSFVNEMFRSDLKPRIKKDFIDPNKVYDYTIGNAKLDQLVSNYNFKPENQRINILPNDTVRFYITEPGKFTHIKNIIKKKINDDIKKYKIEDPKIEIYYNVINGISDNPELSQKVEIVGVLAATFID